MKYIKILDLPDIKSAICILGLKDKFFDICACEVDKNFYDTLKLKTLEDIFLSAFSNISKDTVIDFRSKNNGCSWNHEDIWIVVGQILRLISSNLGKLYIGGIGVDGDFILKSLKFLKNSSSLKELSLEGNMHDTIIPILDILNNINLKNLNISHCYISSQIVSISQSLESYKNLESLDLSWNGISGIDMFTFTSELFICNKLKNLNISANILGMFLPKIIYSLKNLQSLEDLRIDYTLRGVYEPSVLIDMLLNLQLLPKLESLYISNNILFEVNANNLLETNLSEKIANIIHNNGENFSSYIIKELSSINNLKTLNISNTRISSTDIISYIGNLNFLKDLSITLTHLKNGEALELMNVLSSFNNLHSLIILPSDEEELLEKDIICIASNLKNLENLENLRLYFDLDKFGPGTNIKVMSLLKNIENLASVNLMGAYDAIEVAKILVNYPNLNELSIDSSLFYNDLENFLNIIKYCPVLEDIEFAGLKIIMQINAEKLSFSQLRIFECTTSEINIINEMAINTDDKILIKSVFMDYQKQVEEIFYECSKDHFLLLEDLVMLIGEFVTNFNHIPNVEIGFLD